MQLFRVSMCSFFGCLAGQLAAQTVSDYRVYYQATYLQSSVDASTLATYPPYRVNVEVTGTDLGTYTLNFADGAITKPGGARQGFNATPSGTRISYTAAYHTSESELTADYGFGTYTLELGASDSATLDITADVFPNAPTLLGGSWSDGKLQVSDGGYTFNFATPSNTDSVRLYMYQQSGAYDTFSYVTDGDSTSIFVPDSDLVSGLNYGATLYFYNIGDTDSAFNGADGSSGYMSTNTFSFSVTPIPEPSTFGAIIGLVAMGVAARRRKRS